MENESWGRRGRSQSEREFGVAKCRSVLEIESDGGEDMVGSLRNLREFKLTGKDKNGIFMVLEEEGDEWEKRKKMERAMKRKSVDLL